MRIEESELLGILERAGLSIPSSRIPLILTEYSILRTQMALLSQSCEAAAEPAHVFQPTRFGALT